MLDAQYRKIREGGLQVDEEQAQACLGTLSHSLTVTKSEEYASLISRRENVRTDYSQPFESRI